MAETQGGLARRAGRIGLALALWAVAAAGQVPEPPAPALAPAPVVAVEGAEAMPPPADAPAPEAVAPPGEEVAPAATTSLLEQAWLAPADSIEARVERTQRTALELGAWSFDAAARALAVGEGAGSLTQTTAAVALAPDLPAAHMREAAALWLRGGEPMAALRSVIAAFSASGRHLEASLWFTGCGLFVLAVALVLSGALAAVIAGIAGLRHAAHDLGHLMPRSLPHFACWSGLAALLALPLALGEGALGLVLAALGVAGIYGGRAQRAALVVAAAGIGFGAYPVMREAGAALAALPEDPVAQATYAVAMGIPTPAEEARLISLAERDAFATRGLAIHARRRGDLAQADALYQRVFASGAIDTAALNNAASIQLALGRIEDAIELYDRAARGESPVALFNLAQAYGRAFRVEDLNQTITRAQRADGELVARLTALQGGEVGGFFADLPPAPELFRERAQHAGAGADLAREFRAYFAPGVLGSDARLFAVVAALVWIGATIGARFHPSRSCHRCGDRICRRCDAHRSDHELCSGCHTLFLAPEKTDRLLRVRRVNELRARDARLGRLKAIASLLVPGAAGLLAERPLRSWFAAFCFSLAIAAWFWRDGVVPDPLVAGAAGPAAFLIVAVLAGVAYAIAVATALAAQRTE